MKKFYKSSALVIPMLLLFSGIPAYAEETADIQIMKQQIQELISQNRQLSNRISEMEQDKTEGISVPKSDTDEAETPDTANMINKYVSFGGAIEVEASWSEEFEGESSSNIDLATAEFSFEARASEWATAIMAIEWDGDDDKLTIDEAYITIGNTDAMPIYLQAGRFIVPFGIYEGNTISDPLTNEVFETKEDAVMAGFESNGFYANAYVFNGETNEGGGNDTIEHFGGNLGYHQNNDDMAFDTSIDLISSVFDSDGLTDGFPDSMDSDYAPGFAVHAILNMGGVGIIGEYITALDDVNDVEPEAWQIEGFYETEVGNRVLIFSLGYSETKELASILPESRIAAAFGIDLFDGIGLTFEYCHDEDYNEAEGGTDETADAFTTQLAYEF